MRSATELRNGMLVCRSYYESNLTKVLMEWNEKMKHGIPLPQELWYDLFGKQIEGSVEDLLIDMGSTSDKRDFTIHVGIWVNQDNPFESIFSYKVKVFNEETAFFKIGEEDALIRYCEERGS